MILTRTVGVKGIDMALIHEPCYLGGCIRGLNIPGYTVFSANGMDRPRACILTRNETAWMLPGFSCRHFVAVRIKYTEEGAERHLVVCSAYLPYNSEDLFRLKNSRRSCFSVKRKTPILLLGATPTHIIGYGALLIATVEGRPWWNFWILQIWRF